MAELKDLWIEFPPSNSPDVIEYKLYIQKGLFDVTYDSPSYSLGMSTNVNIADYAVEPGPHNVGITAVDDAGNESQMSRVSITMELKEDDMGLVKTVTLVFEPSTSADVVGYKLYIEQTPTEVSYQSQSFDLGNNTDVNLAEVEGIGILSGTYNFGITAVDDTGNESDFVFLSDVKVDLVAPNAPTNPQIVRT